MFIVKGKKLAFFCGPERFCKPGRVVEKRGYPNKGPFNKALHYPLSSSKDWLFFVGKL